MDRYSVWFDITEEEKRQLVRDYIDESGLNLNEDSLVSQLQVAGIRKQMEYRVENVEDPEDSQIVKSNVLVGIVGLNATKNNKDKIVTIGFHYVIPKYRGDFENFYKFLINQLKNDGYTHLVWSADTRTSNFISRNAGNKAYVHQHYGRIDDFMLDREQPKKKEEFNVLNMVPAEESKKEDSAANQQEPKPYDESEVTEKPLSGASTGQYPGEVRH